MREQVFFFKPLSQWEVKVGSGMSQSRFEGMEVSEAGEELQMEICGNAGGMQCSC